MIVDGGLYMFILQNMVYGKSLGILFFSHKFPAFFHRRFDVSTQGQRRAAHGALPRLGGLGSEKIASSREIPMTKTMTKYMIDIGYYDSIYIYDRYDRYDL